MRQTILHRLAQAHASHPYRMLLIVLAVTLLSGWSAGNLTMTTRWSDLLPEKDIRTMEFNKILDEFVSATGLIVVLQGEEKLMKQCAEELADKITAAVDSSRDSREGVRHRRLVRRVDIKVNVDFLRRHGLMLIKREDLVNLAEVFTDPDLLPLITHLNNSLEKEYVGRSESLSTREKEDQAVMMLDGIADFLHLLQRYQMGETISAGEEEHVVDKLLYGEPYLLSYDKRALVLNVVPNFTLMDTDLMVSGTDRIQEIVDQTLLSYPGLVAGLTGMIAVGRDEMVYSQQSLGVTSLIAFVAILVLLILSFRMWIAPVLAGINLIVGIVWASGLVALLVGQLNIMTSMFAVILLGLGIDFSIHILSGFTEYRAKGLSIADAMYNTFFKIGRGVVTGGVTTAVAFLAMMISSSRGMKEMGVVTGSGLLAILACTLLFMPSLLVLRERRRSERADAKDLSFRFLGRFAAGLGRRPFFTLPAVSLITLLLLFSALRIEFDQNYMNIEPKGLVSIALQDTIMEKFDLSMDYGLVLAESASRSGELARQYRDLGTVASVEDISLYLPSLDEQAKRRPLVASIRSRMASRRVSPRLTAREARPLAEQLERLEMNIIEMQDLAYLGGQDKVHSKCAELVGDPEAGIRVHLIGDLANTIRDDPKKSAERLSRYQYNAAVYFQSKVLQMSDTTTIRLTDLPQTILDRYSNDRRDQFLVTVFPAGHIWQDADFLRRFSEDLSRVSERATGMPPVFRALIEIIGRDGRNAALLTLVVMFFVLWLDFRRPVYALLAMVPLGVGVFWMVGLMHVLGLKLTVMNVMGIPLIIGIGIDDGVHVIHRWISEGRTGLALVFSSTGKAILLTSLTTMLGFGSLIFSVWRGFGQLGSALVIGVAACFLTTTLFLPGFLGILQKRLPGNGKKPLGSADQKE